MRPEDFERFRKLIRDVEKIRRSINVDIEQAQKLARDWERMGLSPEQEESIARETELIRELLSDPHILQAHAGARRLAAEMPDASTQRALLESARYFSSREFESQRDAIFQANQIARQYLGSQGLAAAMRIAARDAAAAGSQERAAERIRSGQVTRLLEEASELAASPEVRELIERADLEALVRLDEEEQSEALAPETEVAGGPEVYEDEYLEGTKEDLLERYERALLVLLPLQVALAIQAASPGAPPVFSSLSDTVECLIVVVVWLELMISRSED